MGARTPEQRSVVERLRSWHRRLEDAMASFGGGNFSRQPEQTRELYRAIKEELRAEHQQLEKRGRNGELTQTEETRYRHVVNEALMALRPAMNAAPGPQMFSALYDAAGNFSHALAGFGEIAE